MPKTSTEVCTEALRTIGVAASDMEPTTYDLARALEHMAAIFDTLNNTEALAFEWTIDTVPDAAYLPFARAVGGSLAGQYGAEVVQAAASAAVAINPRNPSLYEVGMDGLRAFAAPDMTHENHVTRADYF